MKINLQKLLLPRVCNGLSTTIFCVTRKIVRRLQLVCVSVRLSICLSVCVSVYLSVCLSVCVSVCLCVCPSVVCMSVCLSVCSMYVCLSVCLCVVCPVCVCLQPSAKGHLLVEIVCVCLSVCLSVRLSVCLYVCSMSSLCVYSRVLRAVCSLR